MSNLPQVSPINQMKILMEMPSVKEQFKNAMSESAPLFVASLIELYSGDNYLQNCDPQLVIKEALKAAVMKLPVVKSLGFAYIVPYKSGGKLLPQFQLGYKGMLQLAMRSGVYRFINADTVYEGEHVSSDKLTGAIDLSGNKTSDTVVGYFAYVESVNGFKKTVYVSAEDMEAHAKKYSAAYKSGKNCPWKTDFHAMGIKTCLRKVLGQYGQMSIELASHIDKDRDPENEFTDNGDANGDFLDIDPKTGEMMDQPPADTTQETAPTPDEAPY